MSSLSAAQTAIETSIGARLNHLRRSGNLTRADIMHIMRVNGIRWNHYYTDQVEAGQRPFRLSEAVVLCSALGVGLDVLTEDVPETRPSVLPAIRVLELYESDLPT